MINELLNTQMFGLLLTLIVFCSAFKISQKLKTPLFNPLLVTIIIIIFILKIFNIEYEKFNVGGSVISTLIAPATVALAVPLYKNFHLLKKHYSSILSGIVVGNTINCILIAYICKNFGYDNKITASFMPKSVTTAIAIGVSENMGGIASMTVILVVLTGITGE